ncbi:peptidylprolyl isomerase [Buchnera aphidicola]|uniref:Periplasmic chaperone PpiD n=1 Tax=Buchnera aphidicola str. USDA (Myzus persicae) TaxID=1009856 RepID=W0NZM2_BUCMP|nr:peptidylprolyl isomerase [Buchnera aphidicola]AHG59919.1 Ppid [Buchnera aphidicola str. USDA (Myzus persicae)]AHG60499.1 Ppid [Buchnera aphidicola str. W106 (Myzus persicae)]AHG61072.1 Ppid [Buchnera aphidicola str. G002 (Myzus persicae)]AHG61644.1 Ppid [Buchnera aphidicola str. F009 (Myzus persicae)]WAI02841.1 MAG: peptidylprolyl isomerase [Buchnera aphidicola (Myzus persicae)]
MTKYFKLRSTHIIVKCILGMIILSLVFSTLNMYRNQDFEKYIAIVNGEKISFKTFQNMYLIEKEKQKKIFGKNFFKLSHNKKFMKETYDYILSQLINNVLLEQYTKKMKLHVNEFKIKEIILNSPIFQKDKKFNKEKYFNYLASINLNNHEYINIIKTKINTQNLINTIEKTNFILEDEQKNIINLLSQERNIKRATLKIDSSINKQNVTDAELKKYFHEHEHNFYIPEKFKISFVELKSDNFNTNCSKQEIYQWYLKNIKKYSTKEKRKYSIIQSKNETDAISILSELNQKPENFSKIAKEKSTDPISSKKGGDIGWISIDLIPYEIKNANLNRKKEISNIIPFHNNFLIIKLDDILFSRQKTINEVYNTIKKEIKNKKSLDLYNNLKNQIYEVIKKNPNQLNSTLIKSNIFFKDTNWFDKNSIPKVLNIPILKKAIFNKKLFKKYNGKIETNSIFFILKNNQSFLIKIIDFQNRKKETFNNVKEKITQKLQIIKAIKENKVRSEKIIFELKKGNTNLFKQSKLHFGKTETISRYNEQPITSIVFSLPHPKKGKKIYALYQDKNKNFVIILLQKVYNKNFSKKEKKIILEYLEKNNTEIIFNSILRNLYEKSTIKYGEKQEI